MISMSFKQTDLHISKLGWQGSFKFYY